LNLRENQIESLLKPVVEGLDCELWGLEYLSQGRRSRLRVFIERQEGVSVEDCERVSRGISDLLDVEDVVPDTYTLEVSSPGLDRILFKPAHYEANIGAVVDVRLNFPLEGTKRIVGVLTALEGDEVVVRSQEVEDEEYLLPLVNIHRARLVPQFD
jgi:ribosome maturation factor RimP